MLKSVRIQNFRSCKDVRIENMGQVLALVGKNGTGKSNILQAIQLFCAAATAAKPIEYLSFDDLDMPGKVASIALVFSSKNISYEYFFEYGIAADDNPIKISFRESLLRLIGSNSEKIFNRKEKVVRIEGRESPLEIGNLVSSLPAMTSILPSSELIVAELKDVIRFLTAIQYYELDEPNRHALSSWVEGSDYKAWEAKYEADGVRSDSVLFRLIYLEEKRKDDFNALREILGSNGLGLIDEILIAKSFFGKSPGPNGFANDFFHYVYFTPHRGTNAFPVTVDISGLSVGTRRVLRMFVSLIFDGSAVMLLEQPEDSLHQGLTKKVIGLLRQNALDTQVILTSHSSALLNKLKPEEIRIVSLHNGLTTVRQLSDKELERAARYMNEEGTLYEFLETAGED